MPAPALRLAPPAEPLAEGFERIRRELGVPGPHPPDAQAEALAAAARGVPPDGRMDARGLELVSIDPPGARDLDQAVLVERRGDGFAVRYAIADVAALVAPGGAVDASARARGVTIYMPDRRSPLHPDPIGEGAGSLLPGMDRPALLWTIELDREGREGAASVERAIVRSRRAISYERAQRAIDAGEDEALVALREVGRLRLEREAERGGVSLTVPVQEIVREGAAYALRFEAPLPVEDWNAQISLLAGMCAARIMIRGGVGLFRTLEPAEPRALEGLRHSARALGVTWPEGASYPEVVRGLDPSRPGDAAFAVRASRTTGAAGYAAWGGRTAAAGRPPEHAAIAAPYAHVTAPLRRLADRVANEIVLALARGVEPPGWALAAMPAMPDIMRETGSRARAAERAALDYVEAVVLAPRVGETFRAVVVDVRDGRPVVQIAEPAVLAALDREGPQPGDEVSVRLVAADPGARRVVLRTSFASGSPRGSRGRRRPRRRGSPPGRG
jgi:exoribonuclease R